MAQKQKKTYTGIVMGVRSACLGADSQVRIPVAIAHNQTHKTHKPGARRLKAWGGGGGGGGSRSEPRCRSSGGAISSVWVTLVCWVVSSESALIGSSSPVSRLLSSSNYILFSPLLFFSLCPLAFLFLSWLGSAADYRPHTPPLLCTPFQYTYIFFSVIFIWKQGNRTHLSFPPSPFPMICLKIKAASFLC